MFSKKFKKLGSGAKFPTFAPQTASMPLGTPTNLFSVGVPTPAPDPVCLAMPAAPPASTPSLATGHPPPAFSASSCISGPVRHPYPNSLPPGTSGVCPGAVKQLSPTHSHQVPAAPPGGAVGLFLSCSDCTHPTPSAALPSRLPWGWYPPTSEPRAPPTGPGECARCQSSHGIPGGYTACMLNPDWRVRPSSCIQPASGASRHSGVLRNHRGSGMLRNYRSP